MRTLIGSFKGIQYELNMSPPEEEFFVCPECGGDLIINDTTKIDGWCQYKCDDCGYEEKIDTTED